MLDVIYHAHWASQYRALKGKWQSRVITLSPFFRVPDLSTLDMAQLRRVEYQRKVTK